MAHNIENKDGVYSFVENGRKERAWHNLGQVFDGPMTVREALELSHANYRVELQPLVAMTPDLSEHLADANYSMPYFQDEVIDAIVPKFKCTMRMDTMTPLGVVSDKYGVVQNEDAFRFIDTLVSGQVSDNNTTPVIETAGVLGKGERVFVTAKFPEKIILDNKGNDVVEMYVVFTTSHDGTGAVNCLVTPIRVVCNNTLNYAMSNNVGKMSLRHSSMIMQRFDLMNKENAEFAYRTLNMYSIYKKSLEQSFEYLNQIRLATAQVDDIVAEVFLSDDNLKVYKKTKNIEHQDITTRGKNIFKSVKDTIESGIGQDMTSAGTASWLINGITCYHQNVARYSNEEQKFDSAMNGMAAKRLQRVYNIVTA